MSVNLWEKGDTITSEKMNSIVNLLNEVEAKVNKTSADVANISNKINETTAATKDTVNRTEALIKQYETKLAEVQEAYTKLKNELSARSTKVLQKHNVKSNDK